VRRLAGLGLVAALAVAAQTGTPNVDFTNSPRVNELIRAGNLYLSLADAVALAIENNLDIELQRYALRVTGTETLRTAGGGATRGVLFTVSEAPAGVGGPLSSLLTTPAVLGRATANSSVSANALALNVLGASTTNLSIQGTVAQSLGPAVPVYDPVATGVLNWTHQTTPQTNLTSTGTNSLVTNTTLANAGIQQGFATGASASLAFNNNRQWLNSLRSGYNPFTGSNFGFNATQPLMRGFGAAVNRRFIRIAANEQRISSLVFRQQLIATVYGVVRLYTDLVALCEDEKVKQETAKLAEKLYGDVQAQVDEGTLAPVELTRANAQVFSTRQDLINASGLREEQEAILKNVLTRRGHEDPAVHSARIVPTGTLAIPEQDETRPVQDVMAEALAGRPDLAQAGLQIENSRIGLAGARNATKPQLDVVGIMQNTGLGGAVNPLGPGTDGAYIGGYGSALEQILARRYPTYGIGLQLSLPVRNRVAEADLARDELQVKQSEIRLRQLQNQARLEIEDALIAMRRARSSYEAAVQSRVLQEQSLAAEQAKFEAGASTSFFVIQYASLLAQARSTEVVARSSYVKARTALERATGTILERNRISFDGAVKGR
jgi:outer membrane protein